MARILLVEDDNMLRELISKVLTRAGHDVVELVDGWAVERYVKEKPFDLAVTDILMPEKDGIETLGVLKKIRPEIKVIGISGGGIGLTTSYLPAMLKLGADATLAKPFKPRELVDMVAALLNAEDE